MRAVKKINKSKNILKFKEHITEGSGISNINKEYTIFFSQYFLQLGYGNFTIENNDDQRLPLYNCLLKIQKGRTYAKFNPEYSFLDVENNKYKLYNIVFLIQIDNSSEIFLLKELITHELTHCIEFYNILKWNNDNKINNEVVQINPKHLALKQVYTNINVDANHIFHMFKYLIYLTLDNEYNSRVSQLYQFLKSFNTKNKNILEEKLKESLSYKQYLKIDNFNATTFVNEMIDKIGFEGTVKITKELNEQLKLNKFNKLTSYNFINNYIITQQDLMNHYKKWERMFKYKNKKHLDLLYKIIKEVINDNPLKEAYNDF